MKIDSQDKIYDFLRSIFRLNQLLNKNAPDILLDMEKTILADRVKKLSSEEIYTAIISWQSFYEEQLVNSELQDKEIDQDLKKYLTNLN